MSNQVRNPFMPFIKDFEAEAEKFLIKYGYEDALVVPTRIDIRDIVTRCMSLEINETSSLSPDMSVQGIITFSKGIIQTYNWENRVYEGYEVTTPTVFIDTDLINSGYVNILLAHEAFHWYKHRQYFVYQNTHGLGDEFAFRCDTKYSVKDATDTWSDEQKMEWQARVIAPLILLPRNAVIAKVDELYSWRKCDSTLKADAEEKLIKEVAAFFGVTTYAVAKRLYDLGYSISEKAFNNYGLVKKHTGINRKIVHKQNIRISLKEAFEVYRTNPLFREYISSGLFFYRGIGFFARIELRGGNIQNHLTFEEHLVQTDTSKPKDGVMFHKDQSYETKKVFRNTPQNAAVFDRMSAYVKQYEDTHRRKSIYSKTANEMMWDYMVDAKWNTAIFQDKTLLSSMDYTRIQKPNHKFKKPAYMAMAVGLGLSLSEFQDVIKQAGLSLKDGDELDDAYSFILSVMQGRPIDECNDFLDEIGLRILGTHTRDDNWDTKSYEYGEINK